MNTRLIGVVVMALVLATTAVVADAEAAVAVANADTEAQAQAQTQAEVQATQAAENQAFMQAAHEALAATRAATATEATAEAATATEGAAEAGAAATAEAEKPTDDKAKGAAKASGKTFKPTMINRDSRLAMRSQRRDIRYPDGALAPILSFGPRPARQGVTVDADVVSFPADSPLARRFARWAGAVADSRQQQKYVTPTYEDQAVGSARRNNRYDNRYVSYVPNAAFFAPRRPTHFEPEYTDEHNLLSGDFAAYFASLGAPVMARGAAPAVARGPRTFEAEYEDEHALLNGDAFPAGVEYVFDVDLDDVLNYERAVYRGRPSAYDMYGLPEFPALPASAAHLNGADVVPPFSGVDDVQPVPSGVHTKVAYPTGSGAKADLQKLDFALNRLATLNAQLRVAEQRVRESRAEQQVLQNKLQRLNAIRANLQKLASQIAALETRVGQNPTVQAEVARVAASKVQGVPVLGEWLKFN